MKARGEGFRDTYAFGGERKTFLIDCSLLFSLVFPKPGGEVAATQTLFRPDTEKLDDSLRFDLTKARLCLPRRGEPAARDYVIAGIVRGAGPSPPKRKKCFISLLGLSKGERPFFAAELLRRIKNPIPKKRKKPRRDPSLELRMTTKNCILPMTHDLLPMTHDL